MELSKERRVFFWSHVLPSEGCWIWTGAKNSGGYGHMKVGSSYLGAHRIAFFLKKGPIPKALHIDHLCRNRICVNPEHLEAVTQRENLLRGQGFPGVCSRRNHCAKGHPYTSENTIIRKNGARICRACKNDIWLRLFRAGRLARCNK